MNSLFLILFLAALSGYIVGSAPFGFLLAKIQGIDLRKHGSGNIGATNVTRVLGKRSGRLVFFFDFIKGYLFCLGAFFIFNFIHPSSVVEVSLFFCAMFSPFFGHVFSLFLRFKGGKGVATLAGIVMFFYPLVFLGLAVIFIVCYKCFKIISLASLLTIFSFPFGHYLALAMFKPIAVGGVFSEINPWVYFSGTSFLNVSEVSFYAYSTGWVLFVAALVVFFHRANIVRLLNGKELGFR